MLSGRSFGREKHREKEFDLTTVEPRLGHILVYELLDQMIVRDEKERFEDASVVLKALRTQIARIKMNAQAVDLDAPHPCTFCGQGDYRIKVDPRLYIHTGANESYQREKKDKAIQELELGLRPGSNSPAMAMVCDFCGHVQLFRPNMAPKSVPDATIGNWTAKEKTLKL